MQEAGRGKAGRKLHGAAECGVLASGAQTLSRWGFCWGSLPSGLLVPGTDALHERQGCVACYALAGPLAPQPVRPRPPGSLAAPASRLLQVPRCLSCCRTSGSGWASPSSTTTSRG